MKPILRFFSVFLSLSLILAAPGLAPYQAAAQNMGASRITIPVGTIGAAGAAINGLGATNFSLSAASLQTGLIPALSPAAAFITAGAIRAGVSAAAGDKAGIRPV